MREEEERTACRLYPRCTGRHELVNCAIFKMMPVEHRRSIVQCKGLCQVHMTHEGHGERWEKECRWLETHWMMRRAAPFGTKTKKTDLPTISHKSGRIRYKCRLGVK